MQIKKQYMTEIYGCIRKKLKVMNKYLKYSRKS